MKKIIYVILISQFVLLGQNLSAQCANEANIYSFTIGGANYEIVKENLTWVDAAACAVERGGFLTEIYSQEQQDSIFYHLNNAGIDPANTVAPDGGGASYVWIGGNDIAVEGEWIWNGNNDGEGLQFWQGDYNGHPVNDLYNNWGDEPDDWNGQDGLGLAITDWPLGDAGQWNDVDDSNDLYYVIEYSTTSVGQNKNRSLLIYPNPATDRIYISNKDNQSITKIELTDISGKLMFLSETTDATKSFIDVSSLPDGAFLLHIFGKDNEIIKTEKIIKQ